ncbi:hypothetical protein, partial [Duganella sp. SG902]|uniref:hypothetical protein n=1 Tax=Duganella sp. SG902 TaxID=2587016 RepID=UPI001C4060D9
GISITMSDRIQLLAIAPRPQLVGSGAKCWRLRRSLTMLVATNLPIRSGLIIFAFKAKQSISTLKLSGR